MYIYMNLWFSSEESSAIPDVGVEKLVETKRLDFLREGPLFWVDSADGQPCMGKIDTCSSIKYCVSIKPC